jgi:CopG family nickel-responsive transcriptional regulator
VILRGPTRDVRRFADLVCAQRGVHHGKLNLISMEQHQSHRHSGGKKHAPHVHLKPAT